MEMECEKEVFPMPWFQPLTYLKLIFYSIRKKLHNFLGSLAGNDQVSFVPWSQLPPFVVEKIYFFLSRKDQCSMSQVCRNWSKEFSSPSLWRNVTFYLPEYAHTTDLHPEIRFARKFGHLFQHVQIICREEINLALRKQKKENSVSLLEVIRKQLKLFFICLAHRSQLLSISFNMDNYLIFLDEEENEDFRESLINLFRTQSTLQSVHIKNMVFEKLQVIEILQTIFVKSSKTLEKIELRDFIPLMDDESIDNAMDVPLTLKALMNLKILIIDYSLYFEDIITSCYEYGSRLRLLEMGALETITLYCECNEWELIFNGIQPEAWTYFRKVFPLLGIDLCIEVGPRTVSQREFNVFTVRHMPVRALDIRLESKSSDLGSILHHLIECEINGCLELLIITRLESNTNLAQDLLNFLQVCPKLRELQLYVESPVESFDIVFEYWLENGVMSLQTVHITIGNVKSSEAASNYINLANKYWPMLQMVGLNLILNADETAIELLRPSKIFI